MGAPDTVKRLVDCFQRNEEYYLNGSINETQLRREFLDPFFTALGWDLDNKAGYADAYKDVIHEYSLKTKDVREAPDYCFRIGGTRKFFVEAKKPSINIKDDIHPAFQLRSYAWSAKLPLSILTDFQEFAVYDCRIPPNKKDKASNARVIFITYDQFLDKWDEIEEIFSRESILKGSFDKYVETNKKKKGTAEVDSVFLEQMEEWRKLLAKNIALRNPKLSLRELNYSVQKTIDRIIFLRICEDRGIEDYGQLMSLQNGTNVYDRLKQIYYRADEKYNSGLFHFEKERERAEPPDGLTLDLSVDDKAIKDIVKELYYPESPYEFSVLPADILGQVYEQFLGKIIRLTAGHQAVIEPKPEVKKAGGVYYTPSYIVEYIVNNTVGKLLEKAVTPKEVSKIKVLDPACGSGSFLLGAYQHLLDWHLKYYHKELEKSDKLLQVKHPPVYAKGSGSYLLTTSEKKRILLNNIFGVDIDSQAVEVTKLSLMLKVLEGESTQTLSNELNFFRERALPDLSNNIKCGNSLIGPDFYDQMEMNFLDEEEKLRINVFDWNSEFKDIMYNGGFDAVIGNPPYVRIQAMKEWASQEVAFYKLEYSAAEKGNYDLYIIFVEKVIQLINKTGRIGFILPNKFLLTDYGQKLREILSELKLVDSIIDFGASQVFKNATTYTCLLFLTKSQKNVLKYIKITEPKMISNNPMGFTDIDYTKISSGTWLMNSDIDEKIIKKLFNGSVELGSLPVKISRGSSTGNDEIFMMDEDEAKAIGIEEDILTNPIFATDFNRYSFNPAHKYKLIFPYYLQDDKYLLIEENILAGRFPNAYKYLVSNKVELKKRKQYSKWYAYSAPRNLLEHSQAEILIPLLADKGIFSLFNRQDEKYTLMASGGFSIKLLNPNYDPLFLLAIINSKLLFWYLKKLSNDFRAGWITCTKQYFEKLPIKTNAPTESYNMIIDLVKNIIELKQKITLAKTSFERTNLERQVQVLELKIDGMVYHLYDLTEEEINSVR